MNKDQAETKQPVDFLEALGDFNFISKYARYNDTMYRRETWAECTHRVEKMHLDKFKHLPKEDIDDIKWAFSLVEQKHLVPSMRSMQFGGKAILAHNARVYNCATRHVDCVRAFSELFYLLLSGCGIGIGLTKKYLNRLPDLVGPKDKTGTIITYTIQDSIEGWSDTVEALLSCYFKNTAYSGRKIVFDYSRIRPEGAPVKTGGGKAPGYKGLKRSLNKVKELLDHLIEDMHLTRMRSVDAYDILMHCADAVLSGGIRRSASTVIFDKDDTDMLNAKTFFPVTKHTKFSYDDDTNLHYGKVTVNGKKYDVELFDYDYEQVKNEKKISWFYIEPQRARSNNSVLLLRNKTTREEFLKINEQTKQFGEPGFVFANSEDQLFNPCFEIGMIPITDDGVCGVQFCNLTTGNGLKIKTVEDFYNTVKALTIIGTLQASYTDFKYLGNASKQITEKEALLGVSIGGLMNNPEVLLNPEYQQEGARIAKEINAKWAKKIGINPAARITCIKPDGNTGATLGCASGIHAYHARRFFRRVQCNKNDPIYKFFKKHNPHMCEPSVWSTNKTDDVITFPITVPDQAMIKSDLTALKHLEIIKSTQQNWVVPGTSDYNTKPVTHNVSCTVLVDDNEWDKVFNYIYDNKQYFAAVSLLPKTGDKIYKQAPMEAILTDEDEAKWNDIVSKYKPVNYKHLTEEDDTTKAVETAACAGGACEIV